jgi:hypothetical protein
VHPEKTDASKRQIANARGKDGLKRMLGTIKNDRCTSGKPIYAGGSSDLQALPGT